MKRHSNKRSRQRYPEGEFTAEIKRLNHQGSGVAEVDGKVHFIDYALPGEQVTFKYTRMHGRYAEGVVTQVNFPSSDRENPPCLHFGVCGGCSLQHLTSESQVRYKQAWAQEQLKDLSSLKQLEWSPPVVGPTLKYRRRARLGVKYVTKKQSLLVGFREKSSAYLAELKRCIVLADPLGDLIMPLRESIQQMAAYQSIAQIEVARADNHVALVIRHLVPLSDADLAAWHSFAERYEVQIYLQSGGRETVYLLSDPKRTETSRILYYTLVNPAKGFDVRLFFHPCDFIQVNGEINQRMVNQAMDWLDLKEQDVVLDLFCGLGNFSLPIATQVAKVVGVEGSSDAVSQAEYNAHYNEIDRADFYKADLTQAIDQQPWVKLPFTKILLDPPRTGAIELIPSLVRWQPEKILYISCNPATFARDAAALEQHGYKIKQIGVMDMFPHTAHVELMALFVPAF